MKNKGIKQNILSKEAIEKIYKIIRNKMPIEIFMKRLECSAEEAIGLIEECKAYGKELEIKFDEHNNCFIYKNIPRSINSNISKTNIDDLIHTRFYVVSDTHLCNNHQQLHLLYKVYQMAADEGCEIILHDGDMVDGDYTSFRKEQKVQIFREGFDGQAGYVIENYPKFEKIKTYFICGSHDETHLKNGGASIGYWIPRCRKDMIYLGQDEGKININNVLIGLDHPGGGSAKSDSYALQKRINRYKSGTKPKILFVGHYHKNYENLYRNMIGIEVPCLCDETQFQGKLALDNVIGAVAIDLYSDKNGDIQYYIPEPIIFGKEDIWEEFPGGKEEKKLKKLTVNNNNFWSQIETEKQDVKKMILTH